MLRAYGTNLWLAEGAPVRFLGCFDYPTRMAIARLADGGLWVWSPIQLTPGLRAAVEDLGAVCDLVAPNKLHHLFLGPWVEAYPQARLHGAPGLAAKRPDLVFHTELLNDEPDPAWAGEIDQVVFRGSLFVDEVVFHHRDSRSALVCDLIQRFDPATVSGFRGAVMRLDGLVGPDGSTPREWRASWWNRKAARAALRQALAWDPKRLVIAHGQLPEEDGRAALARGLRWLGPNRLAEPATGAPPAKASPGPRVSPTRER